MIPTDTIVGPERHLANHLGRYRRQPAAGRAKPGRRRRTRRRPNNSTPDGVIQQSTTICDNPSCTSINSDAGAPTNTSPPTTTVTYGGQLRSTNPALPAAPPAGSGTTTGFVAQTPNGKVPYAGGTLSFPTGSPQSGVFAGNFGNLGTISLPAGSGFVEFRAAGHREQLRDVQRDRLPVGRQHVFLRQHHADQPTDPAAVHVRRHPDQPGFLSADGQYAGVRLHACSPMRHCNRACRSSAARPAAICRAAWRRRSTSSPRRRRRSAALRPTRRRGAAGEPGDQRPGRQPAIGDRGNRRQHRIAAKRAAGVQRHAARLLAIVRPAASRSARLAGRLGGRRQQQQLLRRQHDLRFCARYRPGRQPPKRRFPAGRPPTASLSRYCRRRFRPGSARPARRRR